MRNLALLLSLMGGTNLSPAITAFSGCLHGFLGHPGQHDHDRPVPRGQSQEVDCLIGLLQNHCFNAIVLPSYKGSDKIQIMVLYSNKDSNTQATTATINLSDIKSSKNKNGFAVSFTQVPDDCKVVSLQNDCALPLTFHVSLAPFWSVGTFKDRPPLIVVEPTIDSTTLDDAEANEKLVTFSDNFDRDEMEANLLNDLAVHIHSLPDRLNEHELVNSGGVNMAGAIKDIFARCERETVRHYLDEKLDYRSKRYKAAQNLEDEIENTYAIMFHASTPKEIGDYVESVE